MNKFSKRVFVSVLLVLLGTTLLRAEQPSPGPAELTNAFLRWYLAAAFVEGAEVVNDPRMERVMVPEVLAAWRKEQAGEFGLGYVPFVGQDYAESWAENFLVGQPKIDGNKALVPVIYQDPAWVRKLFMVWELRDGRWWLTDEVFEEQQ
jgi:hypothetical protein